MLYGPAPVWFNQIVGFLPMAKIWKEELDTARHSNKMDTLVSYSPKIGGLAPFVYFVRVCSFTFEFHSIEQINLCLAYFEKKIHPSSRIDIGGADSWEVQRWYERLPMYLLEEPKRQRVVKALMSAIKVFEVA
jgi:hypothetical protein